MDWFRSHHGAPSDPKWLVIARKAKVAPVVVVSTFWMLLDYASQHQDRGTVTGFDVEVAAAFLGVEDEEVAAVLTVMQERGMIADGRLKSWEKRQPKREREDDSTERVQRHREAKKATIDHVTPRNATVTPRNAQIDREKERERDREIETPPTEEEDAREALRPVADTQAGAIFPPDRPLPLLVQDFLQAKAGADAPRWEAELRLKLLGRPLSGSPEAYMNGVLRGWVRDGGPPQPTPQRAQGGPRLTAAEERDARLKAERDADFEAMAEVERRLFADPWAVQEPEPPSLPAGRVRVSDAAFVRPTAPQGRRTTGGLLQ